MSKTIYNEVKSTDNGKYVIDQDTVIGDAMCEASQLFYDAANQIARCIAENNQIAIDNNLLKKAELALAYMQGVDFGLAMDDKVQKWYLAEMEKSMDSIRNSRELAFQPQIYVPQDPSSLMGFNPEKARSVMFLGRIWKSLPSNDYVKTLKDDIVKDKNLKYLFEKGILDPTEFPGVFEKYKELVPIPDPEEPEAADASPKAKKEVLESKGAEDDSSSVLNLRNLLRQNKINKGQYVSGLATLVATGLISKSDFTRLKAAC